MIPSIIPDHLNDVTQLIRLRVCVCVPHCLCHFDTHHEALLLSVLAFYCAGACFQRDAAAMALAQCQPLHACISIGKAGCRLLLIDYGFLFIGFSARRSCTHRCTRALGQG